MKASFRLSIAALVALSLAAVGCGGPASAGAGTPDADAAVPSAADVEFAEITANWSPAAIEGCATKMKDVIGTRDLVTGVLGGVNDPEGKADAEIRDAQHWIDEGNAEYASIRDALNAGTCDEEIKTALMQSWQFFVKAGTAAVQAGAIAG